MIMNMQVEGKTLTKLEMINHLMENLGMTRQDSRAFVENFFSELSETLTKGHQVKLSGFGNFEIKDKSQRPGRNPKTGAKITIAARKAPGFTPGKTLKKVVR